MAKRRHYFNNKLSREAHNLEQKVIISERKISLLRVQYFMFCTIKNVDGITL